MTAFADMADAYNVYLQANDALTGIEALDAGGDLTAVNVQHLPDDPVSIGLPDASTPEAIAQVRAVLVTRYGVLIEQLATEFEVTDIPPVPEAPEPA